MVLLQGTWLPKLLQSTWIFILYLHTQTRLIFNHLWSLPAEITTSTAYQSKYCAGGKSHSPRGKAKLPIPGIPQPPPAIMADGQNSAKRSNSRTRSVSRPTTPLRPSSRSSFRESAQRSVGGGEPFPLNTFEPAFAELSDAVADLEANMMHFQLMHESLARFSESFASFLYGLNMNAFCVDFPEVRPREGVFPLRTK